MPRTSSTKGKHIVFTDVLPKGDACLSCKTRKVRCSGGHPACNSCLRTAKFEGKDLSLVRCDYSQKRSESSSRRNSSKRPEARRSSLRRSETMPLGADTTFPIQLLVDQSFDSLYHSLPPLPNSSLLYNFPPPPPESFASSSMFFPLTYDPASYETDHSYFSDASSLGSSSWESVSADSSAAGTPQFTTSYLPEVDCTTPFDVNAAPSPNSEFTQYFLNVTIATPPPYNTLSVTVITAPIPSPNPFEVSFGNALSTFADECLYGGRTPLGSQAHAVESTWADAIIQWEEGTWEP